MSMSRSAGVASIVPLDEPDGSHNGQTDVTARIVTCTLELAHTKDVPWLRRAPRRTAYRLSPAR
jgi:hypothetical protein